MTKGTLTLVGYEWDLCVCVCVGGGERAFPFHIKMLDFQRTINLEWSVYETYYNYAMLDMLLEY